MKAAIQQLFYFIRPRQDKNQDARGGDPYPKYLAVSGLGWLLCGNYYICIWLPIAMMLDDGILLLVTGRKLRPTTQLTQDRCCVPAILIYLAPKEQNTTQGQDLNSAASTMLSFAYLDKQNMAAVHCDTTALSCKLATLGQIIQVKKCLG